MSARALLSKSTTPSAEGAAPPDAKNGLPITEFQLTILRWVADGKRNAEIAELMGIDRDAVQRNVCAAMDALGTPSRAGAVARAFRAGWIK